MFVFVLCLLVLLFVHPARDNIIDNTRSAYTYVYACFGGETRNQHACTLTDVTMAGSAAVVCIVVGALLPFVLRHKNIFYSVEDIWPIILREL